MIILLIHIIINSKNFTKMKSKRLLSVLLILSAILPVTALADVWQDPETKVNYEYTPGVKEAYVKGSVNSDAGSPDATGDITILSHFTVGTYGYDVTSIGKGAFAFCRSITSVSIQEGIITIENDAFTYCNGLTNISLPSSITTIGNDAFYGCNLTHVTIPAGVTSIGKGIFGGCKGLESISVDEGNSTYDSRDNCNAIIETSSNTIILKSGAPVFFRGSLTAGGRD